ncbi:auxin response factor 13-like [Triticum dicoccoides]|uniref:auxin response factor 13-like n=1 Tax=Triticum dicoccoides TaxID=85692 RepID=UPI001891011B|nr:auxin response factor 13-like [Triticum dicoccoides]
MSLLLGGLGGGNGDPLPALKDDAWMYAAVDLSRLPAAGTRVCYFSRGHHEQWADSLGAPPAADPTNPYASCTIVSVEVRTVAHAPYASIILSPAPDEPQGGAPAPAGDLFLYAFKKLTHSDIRESGLVVPKATASIFPDLAVDQQEQDLVMFDIKAGTWNFTHSHKGGRQMHFLRRGWPTFVEAKRPKSGNPLFLLRRVEDGAFFIELRSSLDTPEAEEDRLLAPPLVLQEEINEAATAAAAPAGQGQFQVTYYPHKETGLFVVPRWELDRAVGVKWEAGMQVRARKLQLHPIADQIPQPATGVITAVHQPISGWRSLEVVWGQSSTSSPTNAWDVEVVPGDNAPPLKKQKVAATPAPQSGDPSTASHVH